MCGIAGVVGSRDDSGIDSELIQRMCRTMVHRGPDDEGLLIVPGAAFGMRRLSIIDLAGGGQPVFNEDRRVWVVFNGEIYNFLELRNELERRGHYFTTHSDTEVIVHLYEEFGAGCVQKLRGMFAFALFDDRRRSLLLARDRLGKKPLHYALSEGRLLFASEIKGILAVAPELSPTEPKALLQYFYFGYIPDPATSFSAIHKLPPGHLLEFERGKISVQQYWDFPAYGTENPTSEEECLEELERRLAEAVRVRLIADVPLGALLSGGIDSSTIVALMARASSKAVKTFSVGFEHAEFNETPYARLVAQKFETEHHELILEPHVIETIEALSRFLDEPFGDSSALPTYYVSYLARKHVTVALSGDGGDEAFGGYERYRTYLEKRSYPVPAWAGRMFRERIYPRLPYGVPGRNLAYSVSLPWAERYLEGVSLIPSQRNFQLLSEDFLRSLPADPDPLEDFRNYMRRAPASDPISRILYLDSKTYLPGDILTKVDRMSMAASLEMRAPMLDHLFLEWVTGLTPQWKMGKRVQKYILTKLAERVGVPREVVHREKKGFALPLTHWLRHELKDLVMTVLLEPRTLQRGYFNESGVRLLLGEFMQRRTDQYLEIWRLLMFELWQRNFLAPLRATPLRDSSSCSVAVAERVL